MKYVFVIVLGFVLTADAAVLSDRRGTLTTAQAVTGASDNVVDCGNYTPVLIVSIQETGTTTVAVEHAADGSNWGGLAINNSTKLTTADPTAIDIIIAPCAGLVRLNTTTCTTCSVNASYLKAQP